MKGEEDTGPAGCDEDTMPDGCHDLMVDRLRYFTGRHMTARDFRDADAYHRTFRHLHNRILHGWGIACGLEVEPHPRPECRPDRVLVRCGLALDCCGREIVVRKDVVAEKIPWDERPKAEGDAADSPYALLLCLKYQETYTEKVPVLYSPQACSSPSMQNGRIREGYKLNWLWVPTAELDKYGWTGTGAKGCPPDDQDGKGGTEPREPAQTTAKQEPAEPHRDPGPERPCPDDDPDKPPPCCLALDCPYECVPLAVIWPERREEIDTSGRRSLARAREQLTHICWISWEHGGLMKESEFRSLRVRFDRALAPPEHPGRPGPRGINERTFVVQFGEQLEGFGKEDLDFVDWRRPPYLTADRRTAVYEIRNQRACVNHVVHVTLRCDFIVDCRKNLVDGDHLGGNLPSGNGLPGGTFESWFRVVSDGDYDQTMEATKDTPTNAQE